MAELPNPVLLWRNIVTVARCKALDALMAIERRVREEYRRAGPRDNLKEKRRWTEVALSHRRLSLGGERAPRT
jgi:hypothetical protein